MKPINNKVKKELCQMLTHVLTEIRYQLRQTPPDVKNAAMLADAFHNLPSVISGESDISELKTIEAILQSNESDFIFRISVLSNKHDRLGYE